MSQVGARATEDACKVGDRLATFRVEAARRRRVLCERIDAGLRRHENEVTGADRGRVRPEDRQVVTTDRFVHVDRPFGFVRMWPAHSTAWTSAGPTSASRASTHDPRDAKRAPA